MKTLLALLTFGIALTACGGSSNELNGTYTLTREIRPYDVEMEQFDFSSNGRVELTISESDGNQGRRSRVEQGTYTVNDNLVDFTFGYSSTFADYTIDEAGCISARGADRYCR